LLIFIDSLYFYTFFDIISFLSFFLVFITFVFAPLYFDLEKQSMYECGFEPFQDARIKFEIHFYIVAILFLVFDLELLYILFWVILLERVDIISYLSMIIFLSILIIGFIFEWKLGILNWSVI